MAKCDYLAESQREALGGPCVTPWKAKRRVYKQAKQPLTNEFINEKHKQLSSARGETHDREWAVLMLG